MRTDDFDYNLPDELIAQAPAEPRDSCRLLVLHRGDGSIDHRIFRDIIDYLEPGDVLVANKTRVMPARLIGRKPTGGTAETLLLNRREDVDPMGAVWECLVNPGKRLKPGAEIEYRAGGALAPEGAPVVLRATILEFVDDSRGGRLVRFEPVGENADGSSRTLDEVSTPRATFRCRPISPITRAIPRSTQTVYAMEEEHSAAAPTAGLHLTPELIERIEERACASRPSRLEVGIDTFRPGGGGRPHRARHAYRALPRAGGDGRGGPRREGGGASRDAVGTTAVRSLEAFVEVDVPYRPRGVRAASFRGRPDSAVCSVPRRYRRARGRDHQPLPHARLHVPWSMRRSPISTCRARRS